MSTGLYGGTFSPVHNGHVRAACLFLEKLKLDKLIIMPAGIPPHKDAPCGAAAELRLEMCRAAFAGISPNIEVSDFEIRKRGKSYTIETVEHLRKYDKITVLCGEDMLLSLHTWHRAKELMKMCSFAVIVREKSGREAVERRITELAAAYGAEVSLLDAEPLEVSSTKIRQIISDGGDISGLVPEKVIDIIHDNGLYRK